jgi:hypothetical protein
MTAEFQQYFKMRRSIPFSGGYVRFLERVSDLL